MKLLYVADNGFSELDGKYYFSKPNYINVVQYSKYFDSIYFLARKGTHHESDIEIQNVERIELCEKYNVLELRKKAEDLIEQVDAVLLRNGINGCFIADIVSRKKKVLISYNGADPYEFQKMKGGLRSLFIAPVWRILEKNRMRDADFGHYCAQFLYDLYPCRGDALICSNVSIALKDENLDKRLKKLDNGLGGIIRIGLIGQLDDSRKGIEYAIKAIQQLKIKGISAQLEIVGKGEKLKWLALSQKLELEPNIKFLGYIADKKAMFDWLDEIDIYIQPSLCEGLPRATIEAMSRGCPVIATRVDAIPELIDDEWLVSPKNDLDLANKLYKMMLSPQEMRSAAIENYNKSKNYSDEIRNTKMNDFYTKVVEECKNRALTNLG